MGASRPVSGDTAATLASIVSLCDVTDDLLSRLGSAQQALVNAQGAIGAEAQARQDGDTAESGMRSQKDAAEALARAAGDQASTEAIAAEARARDAAIADAAQTLRATIGELGDSLRLSLNAETTSRTDAVKTLRGEDADDIAAAVASIRLVTDAITATVTAQRLDFVQPAGRPGDAPSRYTFVSAASALAGPRAALPLVPTALLTAGDSGPVVRMYGAGLMAARAAFALELGRLYRARYVVQRRADPANPSGDAVACGLVYLDQSLRVLGDVVPVRTFPGLITANGRQTCEALVARSAGLGAAFQAPPSARFAVPVVALFGPDALTDVEVLTLNDVSGAFILAPPLEDFSARLAALENADLVGRVQVLESEAGTPSKLTRGSKGDAAYTAIPDTVQVVELLERQYAGDGGHGFYLRTADALPPGADTFTSHGAVFVRVVPAADVAASSIDAGFEAWMAGLSTVIPTRSGERFNNGGQPAVAP